MVVTGKMNKFASGILFIPVLCLLSACVRPLNTYFTETDPQGWRRNVWAFVEYDNQDSTSVKDIDVVVRFNSSFRYDSFHFVMEVAAPDGRFRYDTLQIACVRDISSTYTENTKPYLQNADFNRAGIYKFGFRPLMDEYETEGVSGIGIVIR